MPERRVYKYGTGQPIPEGAVYLSTVAQTSTDTGDRFIEGPIWRPCWLVWHYFLVEVSDPEPS